MKRQYIWWFIGAVLITAGVLTVFLGQGSTQETPDTVRIGAVLPLTGQLSYLGEEERNVILMAQEEINSNSSTPNLEVVIEDSKSSAKGGVSAYRSLRRKGIKPVITSLTVVSEAIKPIAKKEGVIQMVLSVHPDIAKSSDNVIRPYYGLEVEMKKMSSYLKSKDAERVSALYVNTPESKVAINEYLRPELKSFGGTLVGEETYSIQDRSVRNQLVKLKSEKPSYIMTIDFGNKYPTILKEASSIGVRENILGGLGMMTAPEMPDELTQGLTFAAASFVVDPSDNYLDFSKKYEREYGRKPTFDGVYTYDTVKMLYEALRDGKVRKKELLSTTYKGVSGNIKIDSTGTGKTEVSLGRYDSNGNIMEVNIE